MSRTARWVLAVLALQAVLIGVYWSIEQRRTADATDRLGTEPPLREDRPMPPLFVRRRDGTTTRVQPSGKTTLLHVWATWCPPCRAELPGLLALPADYPVDVVAVALDESWQDVAPFLRELDTSNVTLGDRNVVERTLGVRSLPVTFLVQPDGQIAYRFEGARDWTDDAFVRRVLE